MKATSRPQAHKQVRPQWCPHVDECTYRLSSQDQICFGELLTPVPHRDRTNTHYMCIRGMNEEGAWIIDLMINRGDAFSIFRMLRKLFDFNRR